MGVPRREPRPASAERRALGSPREGGGAGAGIANVELPAIARLAGGNSVSLPATTPNSAHLRPTRRPDAAFMRPNHPTPSSVTPTRVARRRMGVPRHEPRPALLPTGPFCATARSVTRYEPLPGSAK